MSFPVFNITKKGGGSGWPNLEGLRFWLEPDSNNMNISGGRVIDWWDVKGNGANFSQAQGAGPIWDGANKRVVWGNNTGLIADNSLGEFDCVQITPTTIITDTVDTADSVYGTHLGIETTVGGLEKIWQSTRLRTKWFQNTRLMNFFSYGNRIITVSSWGNILPEQFQIGYIKSNFSAYETGEIDARGPRILNTLGWGVQSREPNGYMKNYAVFDRQMDETEMDEWITNLPILYPN